ncbi:MAG: hypothetical protein FWC47_04610 [Oscillospiraceae bacterium]|nr:hypothetical protein [Oscillospiraceae bacterium]
MQALEGYYKDGSFYALKPTVDISDYRRVIITILDESIYNKPNTWAELDNIISMMSEKPCVEDFPRCTLGHELIDFEEVYGFKSL